jgi:hypothetical protein
VNVIIPLPPIFDVAQLNLTLVDSIRLVPKQEEGELLGVFRRGLVFKVLLPLCDALEALRASNVIDEDASFGTPVECNPEALIALLACCVPNLECEMSVCKVTYLERHSFDFVADGDVNFLAMEVCTDRRLVYLWGLLLDISIPNISLKKEIEEVGPIRLKKYQRTAK